MEDFYIRNKWAVILQQMSNSLRYNNEDRSSEAIMLCLCFQ